MKVEEAFNGLSMTNPVSIFQAQAQQLFDPLSEDELGSLVQAAMSAGLQPGFPKDGQLIFQPHQKDGTLRYQVETPVQLTTVAPMGEEPEVHHKYHIMQDVTIHKDGNVKIYRSSFKAV